MGSATRAGNISDDRTKTPSPKAKVEHPIPSVLRLPFTDNKSVGLNPNATPFRVPIDKQLLQQTAFKQQFQTATEPDNGKRNEQPIATIIGQRNIM